MSLLYFGQFRDSRRLMRIDHNGLSLLTDASNILLNHDLRFGEQDMFSVLKMNEIVWKRF